MKSVRARYESGVLLPAKALPLKQGEHVSIFVVRDADAARWDLQRLAARPDEDLSLAEAGLAEWADALDAEDRA